MKSALFGSIFYIKGKVNFHNTAGMKIECTNANVVIYPKINAWNTIMTFMVLLTKSQYLI